MRIILTRFDRDHTAATLLMSLEVAIDGPMLAPSSEIALRNVAEQRFALNTTDRMMGRQSGLDLLRHTKQVAPLSEVIVMTAFGTIETAVEAMRMGAHDFVQKPFGEDEILVKVERAVEKQSLSAQISAMAAEFRDRY